MNSNSKYVNELVFETAALELGIPVSVVQQVFLKGQVQFTSRKIGEGALETVMWPHLGKFRPKLKSIVDNQNSFGKREIKKATKKPK